jgi:purine-binding chemotaxis protein CheW
MASAARPTALARAPEAVKGVINLRGLIVPIIDLRTRFGLPQADYDDFTVVIIVSVADKVAGLVVDAVSEVCNLAGHSIQPAPEFATGVFDSRFITGMGTPQDAPMLILLDIDTLMAGAHAGLLEALPQ